MFSVAILAGGEQAQFFFPRDDAFSFAPVDLLGGIEILLLVVRREIEKRHVLFRKRASAGLINFRDEVLYQVLRMTLTLGSPLPIVSLTGDWIGIGDARHQVTFPFA